MSPRNKLIAEAYDDPSGAGSREREIIATARRHPPTVPALPEWGGIGDVSRLFGLSRPRIFKLIALKAIESIHLKDPDKKKGIRLVNFDSVRSYIKSFDK